MFNKFIELLQRNTIVTAVVFYSVLALSAWIANALMATKFIIKDLNDIFLFVFGQLSIRHGIDSVFNSDKGVKP
jgi:hypothetical protein